MTLKVTKENPMKHCKIHCKNRNLDEDYVAMLLWVLAVFSIPAIFLIMTLGETLISLYYHQ